VDEAVVTVELGQAATMVGERTNPISLGLARRMKRGCARVAGAGDKG
jgi:hypothetical protein